MGLAWSRGQPSSLVAPLQQAKLLPGPGLTPCPAPQAEHPRPPAPILAAAGGRKQRPPPEGEKTPEESSNLAPLIT